MGIVRFALRLPHTFYVLAALVLFLGTTAILSMPTDIFPEIDIPVVTVIWQYTGLSTPEMEQRVTTYSEYSLSSSVNGIRDIEAQTLNGISVQKVFFQPDVNLDLAPHSWPNSPARGVSLLLGFDQRACLEDQTKLVSGRDRGQDDPAARSAPNGNARRRQYRGSCRQPRDLCIEARGRSDAHCQGGEERELPNGSVSCKMAIN